MYYLLLLQIELNTSSEIQSKNKNKPGHTRITLIEISIRENLLLHLITCSFHSILLKNLSTFCVRVTSSPPESIEDIEL